MRIEESSEYVKARAVLLAEYFSPRGWVVTAGKNNCILIYVQDEKLSECNSDKLMEIIAESDYYVKSTVLRTSGVTYRFYLKGDFLKSLDVFPTGKFDVYNDD
ncbi:hypothetical protein G7074_00390 [Pedobacter sp. HDW13]|uniref:hypothetical protein n=1 Tax=Pedobacter sp. HDW13 TaxID=2714940 RepID=UPI00140942C3|nr:hypothetical protein [Pedobacter sp. HDW13]QIL37878.1 hypothetical protein G7074_00390 [Pedobacter sp. HDW13]